MLCERNDDVTYNSFLTACTAACETSRSVNAARTQRGQLVCIPEPEVGICRRLVQRKEHAVGLLPV